MGGSILTLALVVVFAVLVALNIGYTTSVNLFGNRIDEVPVVTVAALSFAVGVAGSLLFFLGRSLRRRQVRGLADRDRALSEREKTLADDARASKSSSTAEARREGRREPAVEAPDQPAGGGRTLLSRLRDAFGRRS